MEISELRQGTIINWEKIDQELKDLIEAHSIFYRSDGLRLKNLNSLVVVSQDCDIAKDSASEPTIELLVIEPQKKPVPHPSLTFTRSAQKLHIVDSALGQRKVLQIDATRRVYLPKDIFSSVITPVLKSGKLHTTNINKSNLDIIRDWLALKYSRQAVPDNLDRAIRNFTHDFEGDIAKLSDILDFLLIFTDKENEEVDCYNCHLRFVLNYRQWELLSDDYKFEIRKSVESWVTEIRARFTNVSRDEKNNEIPKLNLIQNEDDYEELFGELEDDESYFSLLSNYDFLQSPDQFTFHDLTISIRYNLNYLCYFPDDTLA